MAGVEQPMGPRAPHGQAERTSASATLGSFHLGRSNPWAPEHPCGRAILWSLSTPQAKHSSYPNHPSSTPWPVKPLGPSAPLGQSNPRVPDTPGVEQTSSPRAHLKQTNP
ncbi:Hypothetical protein NTJ_13012 [Nesidiocoris tenuis]|uniref:Uncharacterized protein n=1 Tax=Nesidiocoris tenuis TaxID=355587 RepID=A0ABN7B726_9HEMI|nr:Hypothetical protein NTJ_13012 [Nesidiocoris tenuis]